MCATYKNYHSIIIKLILLLFLLTLTTADNADWRQRSQIQKWARSFGDDLWVLGKTVTKFNEFQQRYTYLNAQTEETNPSELLSEIVRDISRMMDRKTDAIKCIVEKAETLAETFEFQPDAEYDYYSSKYSDSTNKTKLPESLANNRDMYRLWKMNHDTHFYNLSVSTDYSSVHVPTNVYDKELDVAFAIQWSEELDTIFKQNYNSDPALSWQYFGSSTGIMRHYPAMKWPNAIKKDVFDCRIRTWFIEAATCTKDVIILMDNSGSMDGMGKHIAALTACSILDTFSNNDFVNVLNYNLTTNYTVPCFSEMLVQATEENIEVFKNAIRDLKPMGKTDVDQALVMAFELLEKYRVERGCSSENSSDCNQAIMLITDGISRNFSETIMKYNYLNNGSNIPVRIFTYLVGREVTNVEEILWMACANRGYYTHVQSLEQVTSSVLQYINVIARPLVLRDEHPASWTHLFMDYTTKGDKPYRLKEDTPYRLMTAVAVPAFDKKANTKSDNLTSENSTFSSRVANLLGVAATDVPLNDFVKLTLPYKIGVNGYSFIISNNGYIIKHPDLRPVTVEGQEKVNFNSIDLTEVEQFDDNLKPRNNNEELKKLRRALVLGETGEMLNISIKYHYDDMRRVSRQTHNYYYAPLSGTPFSIAISVPQPYGRYSLLASDEITKHKHTNVNITSFFEGSNWKIHPDWIYCRYHYLEGHEFNSPEEELITFLGKVYDENFKWEKQYGEEKENMADVTCLRKTHEDDDYYCDKDLVQRLVFDAKNTMENFATHSGKSLDNKQQYLEKYNVTLRFLATMSGLTRWEYFKTDVENATDQEFGDLHARAIDETWYKSAIMQHQQDINSFVYSVPFDSNQTAEDIPVTASYAIFFSDNSREAPGAVVGFQFSQKKLRAIFKNTTATNMNYCQNCSNCSTDLECYVIDHNGYIILSETKNELNNITGRFFGEYEGYILKMLVEQNIFEEVSIYDYQAYCSKNGNGTSAGSILTKPMDLLQTFLQGLIMKVTWLAVDLNLLSPLLVFAQDDDDDEDDEEEEEEDKYEPCEQERKLYVLNQKTLHNLSDIFTWDDQYKSLYLVKVPHSNLVFVAIKTLAVHPDQIKLTTSPKNIEYENITDHPCQKIDLNNLIRKKLGGCFNTHEDEHLIDSCGRSSSYCLSEQFSLYIIYIYLMKHIYNIFLCM